MEESRDTLSFSFNDRASVTPLAIIPAISVICTCRAHYFLNPRAALKDHARDSHRASERTDRTEPLTRTHAFYHGDSVPGQGGGRFPPARVSRTDNPEILGFS